MSLTVRKPVVEAKVNGKMCSVDTCTISLTLNGISKATFNAHPEVTDASATALIAPADRDVAMLVGDQQETLYAPRTSPDVEITAYDGNGKTSLQFNGYLTSPAYRIGVGMSGHMFTALHQSVALSAFNSAIYAGQPDEDGALAIRISPTAAADYPNLDSPSVSTRLRLILKYMQRLWTTYRPTEAATLNSQNRSDEYEAISVQNDKINTALLPIWNNLLGASDDSTIYNTWNNLGEIGVGLNQRVCDTIIGIYLQQTGDFWDTIAQFCAAFQLLYVPVFGSDPTKIGSFQRSSDLVAGPAQKDISVTPRDIQYVLGTGTMNPAMPVTSVQVQGLVGIPTVDTSSGVATLNVTPRPITYGTWPHQAFTGGKILRVPAPSWLTACSDGTVLPMLTDLATWTDESKGTLDPDTYRAGQVALNKYAAKINSDVIVAMATEWARNVYVPAAIGASTATVTIPLDLTMLPGAKCTVNVQSSQSEGGGERLQFTGLLTSVTHTIQTNSRASGIASTVLQFTCVEAGSFILAYKSQ